VSTYKRRQALKYGDEFDQLMLMISQDTVNIVKCNRESVCCTWKWLHKKN